MSEKAVPVPAKHATTTGMTGGGFYNANSAPQWNATEAVLPWLEDALAAMPLAGDGPVTLADFGCSEGHNSIAVMQRAVDTLLPRTKRPLQTIHSDLPTNDFSSLFRSLRSGEGSVYGSDRVFSAAVGGSMYDQLLPPRSVLAATTFNAIAFFSRRPVESLPGYIFPNGPSAVRNNGSVSDEDRATFARQAKDDLDRFLEVRARELVPGGKLLVQVFGANSEARTCDGLYDLLNDAVLAFVAKGEISRETYERYYQPVYMRSLEELTAPLEDVDNSASRLFAMDRSMTYEVHVPFVDRYKADHDPDCYARDYVNFFRAFTEAVLRNALAKDPEADALVERIYRRAEDLLKASPDQYPFRYVANAVLLTRKD